MLRHAQADEGVDSLGKDWATNTPGRERKTSWQSWLDYNAKQENVVAIVVRTATGDNR